jgi:hypothetical protein
MAGAIWFLYAALSCLTVTADPAGGYRLTLLDDLRSRSGHHAARPAVDAEVPEAMPQLRPSTRASSPAGSMQRDGAERPIIG